MLPSAIHFGLAGPPRKSYDILHSWIYVIDVVLIGLNLVKKKSFKVYPPCRWNSECLHMKVICCFCFDGDNQWKATRPGGKRGRENDDKELLKRV